MSDLRKPLDASHPPVMRVSIITAEAGDQIRTHTLAVSVLEWQVSRDEALRRVVEALDEAAAAADAAHQAVRTAGPKGSLP